MTLTTADLFRVPLGLLRCRVRSELHRTYHFLPINSLLSGGQGLPDSPVESINSESMSNNLSIPFYFTAAWSSPTPFGEGWRQSSHWTWDVLAEAFLNNTQSPLLSSGTDSMTWFRSGNHDGRTSAHQARSFFVILLPQRLSDGLKDPAITESLVKISAGKTTDYPSSPTL